MERIAVIGATGTIGRRIVDRLDDVADVIPVSHTSTEHKVDLADTASIEALFETLGPVDHIVCAAGVAEFGPLEELSDADFATSLDNKLMGQINVVRVGRHALDDGGSITLTSGVLADDPMPGSAAISTANAGLEGFVRAAALELEGEARVNVVSPGWVSETLKAMGKNPADGTPAAEVARRYEDCISGDFTGEVVKALTQE